MIDYEKLIHELEKLREFLYGAHLATQMDNAGALLKMACQKLDDIIVGQSNQSPVDSDICQHEIMSKYGDCGECGLDIECKHEPEMNFGIDSRPRYEKANNPKCNKCGKFYR